MFVFNEVPDELITGIVVELITRVADSGTECDELLCICDSQGGKLASWLTEGNKSDIHLFKLSFL